MASPANFASVAALLATSYGDLLATRYDSDILRRALPHLSRANPTLLLSGTYYVAEYEPGNLIGCGGWTVEAPEAWKSSKAKRISGILQSTRHGYGAESVPPSWPVA